MRFSNIILMEVQPQHAGQAAAAEILDPVINLVTYWIIPQNAKNILSERSDFIKDSEQTKQRNRLPKLFIVNRLFL